MSKLTRGMLVLCVSLGSILLQGCGGADAQTEPNSSLPFNGTGLKIQKPAGPSDGYDGGLQVFRDTYAVTGGTFGSVNTGLFARTRTGKGQTAFEWTGLFLLDNYSDAGENVALYTQGNSFGKGPTWGLVTECNNAYYPASTCVGQEITMGMAGPDTGGRYGLDVVLADGAFWRGLGQSKVVEGTAGIRVNSMNVAGTSTKWKTGLTVEGPVDVAIDTSKSSTKTAMRLKEGQQVELADGIRIDFASGQIRFLNGTRVIHQFPMQ